MSICKGKVGPRPCIDDVGDNSAIEDNNMWEIIYRR